MTKDLNALHRLDKNERLLTVASLRKHMSNCQGNLVPNPLDLASQSSPINQSPRSHLPDTGPAPAPGENYHSEDVELESLFHENAFSDNATAPTPKDIDLMYVTRVISPHKNKDRILGVRTNLALRLRSRTFIMLDNFRRLV